MLRIVLASALLLTFLSGCDGRQVDSCPAAQPAIGSACSAGLSCNYPDCAGGLSNSCTCEDGKWNCSHVDCLPVPDGGLPPEPDGGETSPVTVTIRNTTDKSLFVGGDRMPFSVQLPDNKTGSASVPPCGLSCTGCTAFCENPYFCDPAPCVLEVPAGESLSLKWGGKLYEDSQSCSCGMGCYSPTPLSPGTYTFQVPFAFDLDTSTTHTQFTCSVLPLESASSIIQWQRDGMGLSQFSTGKSFTVDYTGQSSISLVF